MSVVAPAGVGGLLLRRGRRGGDRTLAVCGALVGAALLLALVGPALAPRDPKAADLAQQFVGPVAGHPLGFDGQGRDLLSRLLAGARTALLGPAVVVALALLAGGTLALAGAWFRGRVDAALSAVTDVLFAFPGVLLAILGAAIFGPSLTAATVAVAIAYVPYVARVLRSAALRVTTSDHVAAARVQGLGGLAICLRHVLPNVAPLLVAQGTLLFGYATVDLAAVSFLGLGVQDPQADWGAMVASGRTGALQGYPAESLAAGACIVLVVVAVNLLGERLVERAEARA